MTCGGTGGHINPAIAVANRIKTISPGAEIAFVGTEKGMEASLVPKAGYPIRFVKVRGFKRKLTLANIDAAVKAVTSVVAAKKIIRDFSPDVVIGTGGYVSWPTVKAAAKLGVPTLIQEQNAFPGVTQRMLAKYADKICVSFEESRKFFDDAVQDKILLTGNPVAASAFTRAQAREKLGLAPTRFMSFPAAARSAQRRSTSTFLRSSARIPARRAFAISIQSGVRAGRNTAGLPGNAASTGTGTSASPNTFTICSFTLPLPTSSSAARAR